MSKRPSKQNQPAKRIVATSDEFVSCEWLFCYGARELGFSAQILNTIAWRGLHTVKTDAKEGDMVMKYRGQVHCTYGPALRVRWRTMWIVQDRIYKSNTKNVDTRYFWRGTPHNLGGAWRVPEQPNLGPSGPLPEYAILGTVFCNEMEFWRVHYFFHEHKKPSKWQRKLDEETLRLGFWSCCLGNHDKPPKHFQELQRVFSRLFELGGISYCPGYDAVKSEEFSSRFAAYLSNHSKSENG